MNSQIRFLKALSDRQRLRMLALLSARKELCVCQVMAVLGLSQPLVSRGLNILKGAGLAGSRREGKLIYYSLRPARGPIGAALAALLDGIGADRQIIKDRKSIEECEEFQRTTGRCDMKSFKEFMRRRK
jgi:ArsR family transcriptional regulator